MPAERIGRAGHGFDLHRGRPKQRVLTAACELFGNLGMGGDSWAAHHPLLLAIGWPTLLISIFAPLAVRRYRRLGR